jgi:hypothetical protein
MITANNVILSSTVAAAGPWRDINNFTALSVHIVGLEAGASTWIEVSNNPNVLQNQPGVFIPGVNAPTGEVPVTSAPGVSGVPITGNLGGHASYSPPVSGDSGDEQDISFSADGTQAMWSPSCLVWNFIRVVKTGGGSVPTVAYLFGQIM